MFRAAVAAFAFLTRLPLADARTTSGAAGEASQTVERELGRAVGFFPLVGLTLGAVVAGLAYLLIGILPAPLISVSLVAILAALTGGLHLDGLADLFDGLGGGRGDRTRTLALMHDSRIGAHGATALALLLTAKILAMNALVDLRAFPELVAFPLLARWAVVPQIVLFPYARSEGLGRAFHGHAHLRELVIATGITGALLPALGPARLKQVVAVAVVSLLLALWLRRRLGGLTGDTYGATIELCETAALFAASWR